MLNQHHNSMDTKIWIGIVLTLGISALDLVNSRIVLVSNHELSFNLDLVERKLHLPQQNNLFISSIKQ